MKSILKIFVVTVIVGTSMSLTAQKSIKIGHIDSQELLSLMPESDSARIVMENETKSIQDQLELMQVEFNNKYNDYVTKMDSLSKFIRQSKEQELQDLQQRIQIFEGNAQQSLQQTQAELFQPIIDKAQKAIEEVGNENGFTYIFDSSIGSIVYKSDDAEDIMELVKAKLGIN
ncbi:OmpH family outer membrane protein [Bacteroidota bacterium]